MKNLEGISATKKLFLLFGNAVAIIVLNSPLLILSVVALSLLIANSSAEGRVASVEALLRLKVLALFVIAGHALSIGNNPIGTASINLMFGDLHLWVTRLDFLFGCLSFSKIVSMVMLSAWLVATSDRKELSAAISSVLRAPWLAEVLVGCLEFAVPRSQRGRRKDGRAEQRQPSETEREPQSGGSLIGRLRNKIFHRIDAWLQKASENFGSGSAYPSERSINVTRDIGVIGMCALAILSTKVMMIFPGLPISPGHKNVFIIPIFMFAAYATHDRLGATKVGLATGMLNFMLGFGKLGPLEILQFLLPGLMIDLCLPLMMLSRRGGLLTFVVMILIGGLAGLGRFSGNAMAILLTGAPFLLIVSMLPTLVSQIAFSILGTTLAGNWTLARAEAHKNRLPEADAGLPGKGAE